MSLSTITTKTINYTVANLGVLNHPHVVDLSPQSNHPSTTSSTKRLIDILGAIVGLIITLLVSVPVAIITLIIDPGPILYSQIRCGLNGRTFRIWKFRSMVVDADKLKSIVKNQAKGHIFKSTDDPRITTLGKFLRRTSLDELPQFWNVLMGDMSIVGTRPPTPDEVVQYAPHHWERLRVKPGITGEWQTHGRSNINDFETIVHMDIDYQRKWSLTYDLMLIFKTIWVVLQRKGAY
ncbi:sugar transferase [Anabaena cylindrica FACHB-243]|uniref:Undecaprenyl-phosphate galactose phosphotransferase n=1 Tax=Anabaena cylindrica (strain ATCC 27899 / PCC 7122) TaxID=272123 RepID=K9ZEC9_ANACC|nr:MULTISPECIES: sugar transferase [Anabaena]AFZ57094.1 Undecaprenyl-phosphate galactose phosphotransferase [Anabaena cylindrica PCC 7122]MBD2421430.1 sugar transferase [Anabaena cylindrica FACHB-243]MBY5283141.1 sugar transferase [Anabaena sp. CCAP 1446/1C]MBY5309139.1 sugar transferase [Anabaena sp. CCAP 1446/1C]MCM2407809.1 sugar transferase [Anabaena sp. CCAP 1446/1C]